MAEKVIGIVGGMGPEATADLFLKILAATPARTDQEHLHILIDCNPKIPPRAKALLEGGPDPTPLLQSTARTLERAGADFLIVACNTAHLFYDAIVEAVSIPVLHIVEETVAEVQRRYPNARTVGVLGGNGTVGLRLYHDRLEARGLMAVSPPMDGEQRIVAEVIRSVKAGDKGPAVRAKIRAVAEKLASEGAQLLLAACTELPLVLRDGDVSVPVVDPNQVLAEAAVRKARG